MLENSLSWGGRVGSSARKSRYNLAIFVHGIFSSAATWKAIIARLQADRLIGSVYKFETFEYDSPKARFWPVRRIPEIVDAADALRTWMQHDPVVAEADKIVLIGHSQGGLIIQRAIADTLRAGQARELDRVARIALIATPNDGSELLLTLRSAFGRLWRHAQERSLRPSNEDVESARKVFLEQCVYSKFQSDSTIPIGVDVFAGASDGIVLPRSARWAFPGARMLAGDHHSVLNVNSDASPIILALLATLRCAHTTVPTDLLCIETDIVSPSSSDLALVLKLQHDAFAPDAQLAEDDLMYWLKHYETTWGIRLHVLAAKVNGIPEGLVIFSITEGRIIAGWLAVSSKSQIRPILLQKLVERVKTCAREQGDIPVVFEVTLPSGLSPAHSEACAKLRLFERAGARVIAGLNYLAPDMDAFPSPGKERPYLLMYYKPGKMPLQLTREEVVSIVRTTYNVGYFRWFSNRFDSEKLQHYLEELLGRVTSTIPTQCSLDKYVQTSCADTV